MSSKNKKLNWSHGEDYFNKKSGLIKKVFKKFSDKDQKRDDEFITTDAMNIRNGNEKSYETLRESLLQLADTSSELPHLISITSCYSGEGVSTVATNLAVTFARNGNEHVLLVDTNFLRPSVHRTFDVNLTPGLGEILEGSHDCSTAVQQTVVKNLFVLSTGEMNDDSTLKYETQVFTDLLATFENDYGFVIFDTPSLQSAGNPTVRLASLVDGVILVIEAERVRWEAAQHVKRRLLQGKVNILGVVLNKRKFHVPKWLYKTL